MSADHPSSPRLAEKLVPEARERLAAGDSWDHGYLDLLEAEVESTGRAQDLMEGGWVPRIYERYWRPAWGRVLVGLRGGMKTERREAESLLELSRGDAVLDLACGPGNFSRTFARLVGAEGLVVGCDVSHTMLVRGVAERDAVEASNLGFVRAEATALPFEDESFDAACCFAALHLFGDPMGALDELARVLAPGGRLAILTSARRGFAKGPVSGLVERASGMYLFGPDEVTRALEERGFTAVTRRLAGFAQFVGGRRPG